MKTLPGKLPPSKDLIIEYALGNQNRQFSPKANISGQETVSPYGCCYCGKVKENLSKTIDSNSN